ncbi:MAG: lysophospholipid acyltransferase family protein [Acidiferrobacterales bacterium]
MLALRSLLFNILMFSTVVVYAILSLFTAPFPALTRYRFISLWARLQVWLLKVVCNLTYRVEGEENLPSGPAIILAKHQSSWETLAFQIIFPPQVWVLKRELLLIPFFGWGLALTQPIAIDRGGGSRALEQIVKQGRKRLDSGRWVVVFPEGTRVGPGQNKRHGIGGSVLAAETGYPVVPVAHNAGSFWPRRGFIKRPGTIRVVIGPVIDSHGRSAQQIRDIAEQWMRQTMTSLENHPGHGRQPSRPKEVA